MADLSVDFTFEGEWAPTVPLADVEINFGNGVVAKGCGPRAADTTRKKHGRCPPFK